MESTVKVEALPIGWGSGKRKPGRPKQNGADQLVAWVEDSDSENLEDPTHPLSRVKKNRHLQTSIAKALLKFQSDRRKGYEGEKIEYKIKPRPRPIRELPRSLFEDPRHLADKTVRARVPPKNLHTIRKDIFRAKLRLDADEAKWSKKEEEQLADVVRQQLIEEVFREGYRERMQTMTPRERGEWFMQQQQELTTALTKELWKKRKYKLEWEKVKDRHRARGFRRTARECYVRYSERLYEDLQRGKFKKEEDLQLLKLSTEHKGYNWDQIATKTSLTRSPWRCFCRYQQSLHNSIQTSFWSRQDVRKFFKFAEEVGYSVDGEDKERCQWCIINARLGPGRTTLQISNLVRKIHARAALRGDANGTYHQERGVWTELQCRCLTVAMCIFGWDCNEFKVVAQHVPNRIGVEVVSRWKFYQDPRLRVGPFSKEEDQVILDWVAEHRRCEFWVMSLGLKNRTHHQIKARFRELCPEESNLLDLMNATRAAVMPFGHKWRDRRRPRSELSAGDFLMHLKEDESGRLTTDDKRADRHLSRINEMRLKMMKGAQNGCEGSEMEPVQDIAVTSKRQRVARKKEAVPARAAETTGQEETKEEEVLEVAGDVSDTPNDDLCVTYVRPKAAAMQKKCFRPTCASQAKEPRLRSKRLKLAKGRAKRKATPPPEMV